MIALRGIMSRSNRRRARLDDGRFRERAELGMYEFSALTESGGGSAVGVDVARVKRGKGKSLSSVRLCAQTLDVCRKILGDEHPDTLDAMDDLARALRRRGRIDDARLTLRRALEKKRRVLGADDSRTRATRRRLRRLLDYERKLASLTVVTPGGAG